MHVCMSPCQSVDIPAGSTVILACDGLWDVLETDEAAHKYMQEKKKGAPLHEICAALLDYALIMGTKDNVSCIIIEFAREGDSESEGSGERHGQGRRKEVEMYFYPGIVTPGVHHSNAEATEIGLKEDEVSERAVVPDSQDSLATALERARAKGPLLAPNIHGSRIILMP
eukprot:GDKI01000327.1.p1 GENE.GDKI01000327.1~~GDKI01000327.1.p1  ORF type:complete len:170 (+),score=28.09 GDKI01000327.1:84-593(+)